MSHGNNHPFKKIKNYVKQTQINGFDHCSSMSEKTNKNLSLEIKLYCYEIFISKYHRSLESLESWEFEFGSCTYVKALGTCLEGLQREFRSHT